MGAGCFNALLAGTTCKVTTLNGEHNPLFGGINPEPIPKNYARSSAYLRKHPHDICLVTDGDADRMGGMDGRGRPLTTHQLICLFLHHLVVNRKGKGRVVKALTTTSMVDKMCAAYGSGIGRDRRGIQYVCAEMLKGDVCWERRKAEGLVSRAIFPSAMDPGRDDAAGIAGDGDGFRQQNGAKLDAEFGPHH